MEQKLFAADDWGLSPAINLGILELARRGWLHSVSILANAPYLTSHLDELLGLTPGLKFSLHFNLTYGAPLAPPHQIPHLLDFKAQQFLSHGQLLRRVLCGQILPAEIRTEFNCQLLKLQSYGIPVSGLDGHHHVHLLPGVSGVVTADQTLVVRLMNDWDHPWSALQTRFFKWRAPQNLKTENCHYLLPVHLRTKRDFQNKVRASVGTPLLVHPALYNDFQVSGMMDSLKEYRIFELNSILRYLNELHP